MKTYVKDGTVKELILYDPVNLGYLVPVTLAYPRVR